MIFKSLFQKTEEKIKDALLNSFSLPQDISFKINVEPTKDPTHGDIATNIAMILAPQLKTQPKLLAEQLVKTLKNDDFFQKIEIAGPGFINFTLQKEVFQKELLDIFNLKTQYGASDIGKGKTVNIEFVSANPTGPLHAGHGRNAILGDVIASLFQKVGFSVVREYYINDAGGQVDILAESVYLRYKEALGIKNEESAYEGKYPGDYLVPVGKAIADKDKDLYLQKDKAEWLPVFKKIAIDLMLEAIKDDLNSLGVHMNVYTSEKQLAQQGLVDEVLAILKNKGDIYEGILTPPKGHTVDDWEERPQTLFKSTKYGDDIDRALQKSDQSWTYFAGDLGYHLHKLRRSYDKMINIFGADHIGYIKRLKSAVSALSDGKADFDIKSSQMVNFLDNGVPVRMSKRAGTFITLKDVIDRVGKDATRYMMVSRHQDMPIDFDFTKVIEESKDNPIFYIQYANARIHSVLRHAKELNISCESSAIDFTLIEENEELAMIKLLSQWPRQIEIAVKTLEPHRIANYLYQLAQSFHSLWNMGKDNTELRFIDKQNKILTISRLGFISCIAIVIESGLELIGITPLKEMR
jgi:arginyl-tRNA synthetase